MRGARPARGRGAIAALAACAFLLGLGAATARAQYLLTGPGDGGQLQLGTALAFPLQTPATAAGFPPQLGVPPIPGITPAHPTTWIRQGASGTLTIPPGILSRPAPGAPVERALFATDPAIFQVATSLRIRWPAATAALAPGGGPGPTILGSDLFGPYVIYSGGARAFGGAARFEISAGPGAAAGAIPGQPVTLHLNFQARYPASATRALLAARNATLLQPGASLPAGTVGTPGVTANPAIVSASFGPLGTVLGSVACGTCPGVGSRLTGSKGFPWTTGLLTIVLPSVTPPETFFLSGSDMRVSGVGNITLVSGGVALRKLTGPTASRAWLSLTLPEPNATLGAACALAVLASCYWMLGPRRTRRR